MTLDIVPSPRKIMRRDASELALLLAMGQSNLPEPLRTNVSNAILEIKGHLKEGMKVYGAQATVSHVVMIADKFPDVSKDEVDEILVLRKSLKYEE